MKRSAPTDLVKAIHVATEGGAYLSPDIADKVIASYVKQKEGGLCDEGGLSTLSDREREVLQFIAEGHANREIADALFISTKTVEAHRGNIQRKLGISGTAGLTKYAIVKGLVDLGGVKGRADLRMPSPMMDSILFKRVHATWGGI